MVLENLKTSYLQIPTASSMLAQLQLNYHWYHHHQAQQLQSGGTRHPSAPNQAWPCEFEPASSVVSQAQLFIVTPWQLPFVKPCSPCWVLLCQSQLSSFYKVFFCQKHLLSLSLRHPHLLFVSLRDTLAHVRCITLQLQKVVLPWIDLVSSGLCHHLCLQHFTFQLTRRKVMWG